MQTIFCFEQLNSTWLIIFDATQVLRFENMTRQLLCKLIAKSRVGSYVRLARGLILRNLFWIDGGGFDPVRNETAVDQFRHRDVLSEQTHFDSYILNLLQIFGPGRKIYIFDALWLRGEHVIQYFRVLPKIWRGKFSCFSPVGFSPGTRLRYAPNKILYKLLYLFIFLLSYRKIQIYALEFGMLFGELTCLETC